MSRCHVLVSDLQIKRKIVYYIGNKNSCRMYGCGSHLVNEIVQKETVALKEAMMQLSENGTQSFDPRICLLTSVVNGLTAAVCKRYFTIENIVLFFNTLF